MGRAVRACGEWLVTCRKSLAVATLLGAFVWAQPWGSATDGRFVVQTASPADREALSAVFPVLQDAARDLRQDAGLTLPRTVTVRVYPSLAAFGAATGQPWYVAAIADREHATLHLQRLRVLTEQGSLETTLRHELFHLAQPESWPRWRAEGAAMRFAGERPTAPPLVGLSKAELSDRLAAPRSAEEHAQAAATAWAWTKP